MPAAVVLAAAPLEPTPRIRSRLAGLDHPTVVAADDGATTALALGLKPDVVIGDLDSLEAPTLAQLRALQVPIEAYPRDKDRTDGQLAIERALTMNPSELILIGFLGGPRLDQWLANILLLTRVDMPTVLVDEANECILLRPGEPRTWRPDEREIISLIPLSSEVTGITTDGLRWSLTNQSLRMGDTRGISNEPVEEEVGVQINAGLLLVARHFPR